MRVVGVTAVWLGMVNVIRGASAADFSISLDLLGGVLGWVAVLLLGIWLLATGEELPEDTDDRLVPRRYWWYAIGIGFTASAVIYTAELFGIVTL